jgi:tetratricopeptide (TPR) repeat protein
MMPKFSSQTESDEFLSLSKTIQAGNYEDALAMSKDMLERYPDNKHIYHNQIGAMIYLSKNDYWGATRHYVKALEYGFPADTCEENIWESAEDSYKFLIDSEEGFCSIMSTDDGTISARTYTLVVDYMELFPRGKYRDKADELIFIYLSIQEKRFDTRDAIVAAYNDKFPNGSYHELLEQLCRIYFK